MLGGYSLFAEKVTDFEAGVEVSVNLGKLYMDG